MYTYIRCTYGNFSREITIHTVIYGVYIRFRPTLYRRDACILLQSLIIKFKHLRRDKGLLYSLTATHMQTHTHILALTRIHTHTHIHTRACKAHAKRHTHTHTHTHTHIHTHTHTKTHTHTYHRHSPTLCTRKLWESTPRMAGISRRAQWQHGG